MAMICCAECKKEISNKATSCPGCGAKVPKSKTWVWVLLSIPVFFFAIMLLSPNSPRDQEKAHARVTIELCWSDQGKKSNSQQHAQFIAGACESLEQEFITKFGHKP
jgi:hypothetical protein